MRYLSLVAVIALIFSGKLYAQDDEQRPNDFFDRNYVNSGVDAELQPEAASPQAAETPSVKKHPKSPKTELKAEDNWLHETESPSIDPTPANHDADGGTPITSVGAILNRADVKHFEQALQKLIVMAERSKVKLGAIYAVGEGGDFSDSFEETQFKLMSLGAQLRYGPDRKDAFKVQKSPSWLIETKDGIVVIEGAPEIGRYVTNKGLFVAPEGSEEVEEL